MTFDFDDDNLLTRNLEMAKMANLTTAIGSGWITRTMTYDKAGLLTTKTDPCGCGGGTDQYFTYDAASRLTTKRDALNNLVRLGLDKAGRTTKVSHGRGRGQRRPRTFVVEYDYNEDGHLTVVRRRVGARRTALCDDHHRGRLGTGQGRHRPELEHRSSTGGTTSGGWSPS